MVENVNLSRFSHFRFDFQIKRFKVDFFNRSDFLYMEGVCVCVDVKKKGGGVNGTHSMRVQWKGQNNDTADLHWGGFTT